jgi:hypothetical protein
MAFIMPGACENCVINMYLKTVGPAVLVIVRDRAYTSTSSTGSSSNVAVATCSSTSAVSFATDFFGQMRRECGVGRDES